MYVSLEKTFPNGAVCQRHIIHTLMIDADNNATVTLNSYSQTAIDTALVAGQRPLVGWQMPIVVPVNIFNKDPRLVAYEYLIGDGQYLAGGTIVQED